MKTMNSIWIGSHELAQKVFVIAEIGANHEGDMGHAKDLISLAKEAGADAVKFQTYQGEKIVAASEQKRREHFNRLALSWDAFSELMAYAKQEEILFLSTPFDVDSVDFLDQLGVQAFKVSSGDFTCLPLLKHIYSKNKPVLISTGLATDAEIAETVQYIKKLNPDAFKKTVLLHCVTSYPTPVEQANMGMVRKLQEQFSDLTVGYSDHSMSLLNCYLAVAWGARVIACAEGALEIKDGKAKVVKESFCDGLGACIGHCPQGALEIIQKNVDDFDEKAVETHLKEIGRKPEKKNMDIPCACPGMAMKNFDDDTTESEDIQSTEHIQSQLKQWPIQLHLVSPAAPYFKGANLLVAASCAAFSMGNFHQEFIRGHKLVIACPKLDRTDGYVDKLAEIIKEGDLKSITVARMEVPCCGGLTVLVQEAIKQSGKKIPFLEQVISLKGEIL